MDTYHIEFLLNKLQDSIRYLIISEDEATGIIQESLKPLLIICNTDPAWLPGEHWIAFYFPKNDVPEFFDSFGHLPRFYSQDFVSFLMQNSKNGTFKVNQWKIQTSESNLCGLYCVLYALSKSCNHSFFHFLCQFNPLHREDNDVKCIYLIECKFNVQLNINR